MPLVIQILNTVGLVLALAGVLLLFRYQMPYRLRTRCGQVLFTGSKDTHEMRRERRANWLSWLGRYCLPVRREDLSSRAIWILSPAGHTPFPETGFGAESVRREEAECRQMQRHGQRSAQPAARGLQCGTRAGQKCNGRRHVRPPVPCYSEAPC